MVIGFDISALSLPRSGVGNYQFQLLRHMIPLAPQHFFNLYAFNFRNRHRFDEIRFDSPNYAKHIIPIPQKAITAWWLMFGLPKLEAFVPPCDVYQVSEICLQPSKKAKTVAFVHDLTTILFPQFHTWGNRFLHRERFKRLDRADAILTNSEYTKKDIAERLGIKPEKIFVTHLGADESFRPLSSQAIGPILAQYQLSKPYILFVGTLEPRKNLETLIVAFNGLKAKRGIPHTLVLAGQKGWRYRPLLEAIERSPYHSQIKLLDYLPDQELPALMNGADIFVYPSFYEGFGLPVLEAMQCGTPVVTSNVSSLSEVGGDACLYVDPHSVNDLTERIFQVIHDAEFRKTLSRKGIERAKLFSWDKCARETIEVYESL